ncbi:MAG: DUF366 family protein [Vampirovibrionales bacterium]|nr:DUF366 family protein [Vampirovibrionales bacterium]
MKTHFMEEPHPYTGEELVSHWIYRNAGILGDAVAAFIGPCHVDISRMVDLEDVLNEDYIYSKNMLHFIIELFGIPLEEGVVAQRLFSSILQDRINAERGELAVRRIGDDLFYQNTKKLSVSICTISPTSCLIHTGLNIDPAGAPVEAAGLGCDLGIEDARSLANACMRILADEWQDIKRSTCKVKAVR